MSIASPKIYRSEFRDTIDQFTPKQRAAVLAYAVPDMWWRRIATRLAPALVLQLAIDPSLESARWMLDECGGSYREIAKEAGLEVRLRTRPAKLKVVGYKVRYKTKPKRRRKTKCSH